MVRGREHDRRIVPFWVHQGAEYLGALLLAILAAGMPRSAALVLIGAGLLALLAALSDGPLGCSTILGRSAHQGGDFALVALFGAAPLLAHRRDVELWLVAEGTAILLAVLCRTTRYAKRARPGSRPAPLARAQPGIGDDEARSAREPALSMPPLPSAGQLARALGRVVGRRRAKGASPPS